jgi:hypothetical protein
MTGPSARLLLWTPRVLGVATCAFIGLFALDAFSEAKPVRDALADFAIHLIPALVLLAVVALAWRWEWIGGVMFMGLAVIYATTMARGHLDWMLVIGGPLLVVGSLFLWSWRYHDALHAHG